MRDLIPPQLRRLHGFELAGGYRASEDHQVVGGDFYDVHPAPPRAGHVGRPGRRVRQGSGGRGADRQDPQHAAGARAAGAGPPRSAAAAQQRPALGRTHALRHRGAGVRRPPGRAGGVAADQRRALPAVDRAQRRTGRRGRHPRSAARCAGTDPSPHLRDGPRAGRDLRPLHRRCDRGVGRTAGHRHVRGAAALDRPGTVRRDARGGRRRTDHDGRDAVGEPPRARRHRRRRHRRTTPHAPERGRRPHRGRYTA